MTASSFRIYCEAALVIMAALSGCQKVPILPGLTTYRIDVQQGNVVTQEMVAKLKPGMTRQQVRYVMGTPPITDAFHPDRWDYVYYLNKRGEVVEHRRLVLLFEGDVLKRVEGDVVAASGGSKESSVKKAGGSDKAAGPTPPEKMQKPKPQEPAGTRSAP